VEGWGMIMKILCPKCSHLFSIELVKAQKEIDRLQKENNVLSIRLKAMEIMRKNNPLGNIFGGTL
jgi:hypothetical protein